MSQLAPTCPESAQKRHGNIIAPTGLLASGPHRTLWSQARATLASLFDQGADFLIGTLAFRHLIGQNVGDMHTHSTNIRKCLA